MVVGVGMGGAASQRPALQWLAATNEHPRARDSSGTFANYSQTKTHTRATFDYVVKTLASSTAAAATEAEAAAVATVATAAGVGEIYERKMAASGRAPNT